MSNNGHRKIVIEKIIAEEAKKAAESGLCGNDNSECFVNQISKITFRKFPL